MSERTKTILLVIGLSALVLALALVDDMVFRLNDLAPG
jgi:hypothetical protein